MKQSVYILFLFPLLVLSQKATHDSERSMINMNFSKSAVLAYQEQAISTIEDFYNYINLYNNAQDSKDLENEIDKGIENLFLKNGTDLQDIFGTNVKLSLDEFIAKAKRNNVKISVSNLVSSRDVSDTYFVFSYHVEVTLQSKKTHYNLQQKVYFFPSEKQFGNQSKTVWQLKLGTIEIIQ